jgi:S-adenosylmethionine-diacylglycerol 3-amino-3-carboxypropyl transferase
VRLRDLTFQRVFANLFVYNVLYEDSEVDERFLGVDESSSILAIAGAGCRVAGHLSAHPRRIDAVDINRHHLALTALKVSAAQQMTSYAQFYELFGRGRARHPERQVEKLVSMLPSWVQEHWKRHHRLFARSLYDRGVTAQLFGTLRRMSGVDAAWLGKISKLSTAARVKAVEESIEPVLRRPHVSLALRSPLPLVALGINFEQRERLVAAQGAGVVEVMVRLLKNIAATDVARNWFAWMAVAGRFNHDLPDAVPPYLRRDRHARSLRAPTSTTYHHRNICAVLGEAGPRTWSHYTVCDAPDWMPARVQRRLFDEVLRTSRDGAILQVRSVEEDDLIAAHGLGRRFERLRASSDAATRADRSRLYRRVDYYRVCH